MQLILPTSPNIKVCVYNSEYNSCLQVIKARKAKHIDKTMRLSCLLSYYILEITYEHLYNKY